MKRIFAITALLALAILVGCSSGDKSETSVVDKKADTQLKAMSAALGGADRVGMDVEFSSAAGFPEVMEPGTVNGKLVLHRPNKAASLLTTEGKQRSFIYDGTTVTIVDLTGKGYAQVPARATIDETITMLEEEYAYEPVLSDFLYSDLYTHFLEGIQEDKNQELKSVKYVGLEDIGGVKAHHLAFDEEYIDWDLWIAEGTSLPLQIDIVGAAMDGKPKMQIDFLRVELNGTIDPKVFTFVPTDDLEKIPVAKPD